MTIDRDYELMREERDAAEVRATAAADRLEDETRRREKAEEKLRIAERQAVMASEITAEANARATAADGDREGFAHLLGLEEKKCAAAESALAEARGREKALREALDAVLARVVRGRDACDLCNRRVGAHPCWRRNVIPLSEFCMRPAGHDGEHCDHMCGITWTTLPPSDGKTLCGAGGNPRCTLLANHDGEHNIPPWDHAPDCPALLARAALALPYSPQGTAKEGK